MSASDPPIIITGGSVSIEFDESLVPRNGTSGRFRNGNKKIRRVEVNGSGINLAEDTPNGQVVIKVYFENK